jgi:fatty acyl-CoA reductase
MVIFRPAIVTGTEKEPFPGWCDNLNGPVGLLIACGFGVLRTMYASSKDCLNCIAVDIACKTMIASAWDCGISRNNYDQNLGLFNSKSLKVFNCASVHHVPLGFLVGDGRTFIRKTPFHRTLWAADGGVTKCKVMNYYRVLNI